MSLTNMLKSVIIPIYNGQNHLPLLWSSLLNSNGDNYEYIIINDGSKIDITKYLDNIKNYNNCSVINNNVSRGFSYSVNRGIERSKGGVIFILNSDLILKKNTLANLADSVLKDKNIGVASAKLIFPQAGGIQHIGLGFTETNHFHIYKHLNYNHQLVNRDRHPQAVAFALCCFRNEVIKEIGPLNEQYVNGYEDIDYCFRLKKKGYESFVSNSSVAYHWERQSGSARSAVRKDNIARLWRDWGNYITSDMDSYSLESLEFLFSTEKYFSNRRFILVDLAKGNFSKSIVKLFRDFAGEDSLNEYYDFKQRANRDYFLWLPMILPVRFGTKFLPFVYVVDEFLQLKQNYYWFDLRSHSVKDEIILDLNGNALATSYFLKRR